MSYVKYSMFMTILVDDLVKSGFNVSNARIKFRGLVKAFFNVI